MSEIDEVAAKLGVSARTIHRRLEDIPRKKVPPSRGISVRVSAANWKHLKPLPNYSETVNRALEKYFTPEGSRRPPRQ